MRHNLMRHRGTRGIPKRDRFWRLAAYAAVCVALAIVAGGGAIFAVDDAPRPIPSTAILYPAEQLLIAYCMSTYGFTYYPAASQPANPMSEFPFVISNLKWASANGFGRDIINKESRNDSYVGSLSEANANRYATDLNGSGPSGPGVTVELPTGERLGHSSLGCIAYAEGILYSNFSHWFRLQSVDDDLAVLVRQDVEANSKYVQRASRWSSCMRSAGYLFSTPASAMEQFLSAAPAPSDRVAKRAAITEVHCALSVKLATVARTLAARYQLVIQHDYAATIAAFHGARLSAVPRARQVLELLCKRRPYLKLSVCSRF